MLGDEAQTNDEPDEKSQEVDVKRYSVTFVSQ